MGYRGVVPARTSLIRPLVALAAVALPVALTLTPLASAEQKKPIKLYLPHADAGAPPSVKITKTPPDPTPMREKGQWVFDLRYDKGDLYLLGVHRIELPEPQPTPRAMGRFALELFEGPTLIERVRFDFPMLGAGELADAGRSDPPSLIAKLVTRIGVMFPATTHGTRLELWDRAGDKRYPLVWPPGDTRGLSDAAAD